MQKGDENDAAKQVKSSSSGDGTVPTPPSGSPASRQGQGVLPQFTVTSHLQALTPEAAQTALGLVHGVRGTLSSAAFTLTPALSSVVSSPQTVGWLLSAGSSAVSGSPLGQPAVVSGATINVLQRQLSGSVMGIAAVTPQLLPSSTIAQVVSLASAVESSSHKLLLSQSASGQISSISASGSTIHHHGQSPVKGPTPTTSNLLLNSGMNTQGHESQTQARRPSLGSAPSSARQGHLPGAPQGVASLGVRQNPSPAHGPPPKKKIKLEEKPPPTTEVADLRRKILAVRHKRMCELKESHIEHLTEMFFLQNRGNIMEYHAWKKRPTPQLVQFLKTGHLDSDEEEDRLQEKRINDEVKVLTSAGSNVPVATPVAISTTLPPMVSALNQQGTEKLAGRPQTGAALGISLLPASGTSSAVPSSAAGTSSAGLVAGGLTPHGATTTTSNNTTSQLQLQLSKAVGDVKPFSIATSQATKTPISAVSSLTPGSMKTKSPGQTPLSPRQHTRQHSISAVYDSSAGSQEAIVERAKQEVDVLERVNALRKEGLWSQRKLPKVQEPARQKAHWDYLLEEVQWLATDFVQERKWKKASARKLARGVQKHFQDLEQKELRAEKEEGMKLKRLASQMAKMVKEFWINIEKVVQYKQKMIMEEKRKKALDIHLSYIVDQTEKYSSWLQKGLQAPASISGSISSPCHSSDHGDDDFEPIQNASDDEETIAREEEEAEEDDEATRLELEELQKEGEMSIEELLQSLPQEVLDKPAKLPSSDEEADSVCSETNGGDADFAAEAENDEDVEETIEEAEEADKAEADYAHEIDDLETENNMTVEELRAKYAGAYDSDFEFPQTSTESESDDDSDDESDSSEQEEEEEDMEVEEEASSPESEQPEIGLEYLMKPEEGNDTQEEDPSKKGPGKEITDIAAEAQSLQPKGYTLETTEVKTPVPFLLKHSLREYQHVGLDWLATLFEKRLNGILADEMGLGKTIQTIALLAHLAGTKGIWGPHLIVVPTSVMLNWEMEFKKWCPAFKILTYYGTQKERKMKRQGWTKTNAFHVCITSYKLVVQDHAAFRRKKWKYLILDEAQNIKNFKSQRWQMLLNFNSQRRLLLTGTPLQNSLMELWSLMHFLMPNVFQSAKEFKEWFSNPLTGMIEGSQEYNDNLIKRLHRVLRPFLLRRLKDDVEKQMPKKYEHVIMCRLSKRQRYLYDDFMAQAKTKETLASGHFMSVINVLMQLRKVCNHPNLFDPRPTISPFQMEGLTYHTASLVLRALEDNPFRDVDIRLLYPSLSEMDANLPKFVAERVQELQTPRKLIEEIDDQPDPPPPQKPGKLRIPSSLAAAVSQSGRASSPLVPICQAGPSSPVQIIKTAPVRGIAPSLVASSPAAGAGIRPLTRPTQLAVTSGNKVQLVSAVTTSAPAVSGLPASAPGSQPRVLPQQIQVSGVLQSGSTQPITLQIQPSENGTKVYVPATSEHGARVILPGNISGGLWTVVQTPSGQQLVPTTAAPSAVSTPSTAASSKANGAGAAASTVPGTTKGVTTTTTSAVKATEASSASTTTSTTALTGSTSGNGVTTTAAKLLARKEERKTPFYLRALSEKRVRQREDKLDYLARTNAKRCDLDPVWPQDLLDIARRCQTPERTGVVKDTWRGQSSAHIQATVSCSNPDHPNHFWQMTSHLREAVLRPDERFCECKALLERFVFATPPVAAPCIQMRVSHPHPSNLNEMRCREFQVHQRLSSGTAPFHKIMTNGRVQFPELRLIQYDCGKLQALDQLLRKLKSGNHRVLIFTQMTRMLDVFEAFLNYHGHRYLRLDGTTKVDQRQALMERFNADKRIFCFILSTRSGGIGVNLTGADTVIFYDSDWNPTMDAQAQDRCHRIGQTRDVHIYRLICEKTVEENILKKANQKRLLGDLAIEGGNFTTAFFKEQTIKELFAEPSGLDSLAKEKEREAQEKALKREQRVETPMETEEGESSISGQVLAQYEQALGKAEDETDAMAASLVKAEQKAELDEFDENIPWDEKEAEARQTEELTRTEMELLQLDKELSCIERYAVAVMEAQIEPEVQEELALAEEDIEQAKTEWEFARLKALKEEEERRAELEEDEMLFTYAREENSNQIFISDWNEERMPIWAPPTPPQDDNDIYIDHSVHFLYEYSTMTETQLPAVYVRKDHRKPRIETVTTRKQKQKKEEQPRVPRSLFDRPTAALVKMRREQKMLKLKQGLMKTQPARPMLGTLPSQKPAQEQPSEQQPEWTIFEDWALLQAVQTLQNLPLNLTVIAPAHTPNWDMVSEVVNNHNAHHRTAKQCRLRYENTIIPREEGRILYDISPRKQKKTKGIYKTKNNRPMKTSQLFVQEGSNQVTEMHSHRFDVIRNISAKRPPALRQVLVNPNSRNPKHLAILQAHNIDFDNPLTPVQVAANRAERIAREKKQTQNAAAAAAAAAERQAAAQQGSQQGQATASTTPTVTAVVTTAAATPVAVTAQQLQPLAGSTAVLVGPPDSLAKAVANNLRVQARPGGTPYITTLASSGQVAQLTAQVVASQPRAPTSTTAVPASTSLPSSQRIATIAGPTATGLKNINILRQSQSMVRGQGPQAQKLQPTKLSLDPRQQSIKRVQTAPIATQKVITQYNLAPGQKQSVVRLPDHTIEALKMQQLRQKVQTTHVGPQIMAQVQMAQTLASSQPVATLVKSVPAPTGSIPNVTIPVSINVSNQQKVVAANRATVSQLHQQQKLHLLQQQQQQRKVTPQMQAQKMQSISHLQSRGIPLIIPNKNIPGSSQLTQTLLQQIVKQQQQQQAQGGLTGVTTHGSQPTIIVSQNPPAGASATATVVPKSSIATAVQSSQIQTMAASAPITITQVPAASTAAASSAVSSVTGMAQAVMKAVSGTPGVSTVQLHTMPAGGVGQQAAVQRASLPQSLMTTTQLAQQQAAAQPQQQQVAAHPSPASTPTQQLASPGTPTTLQTIQVQAAVPPPASPSPTPTQPQIPGTPTQIPGGSVSPSQQPKASPYAMRTRNTPKHS